MSDQKLFNDAMAEIKRLLAEVERQTKVLEACNEVIDGLKASNVTARTERDALCGVVDRMLAAMDAAIEYDPRGSNTETVRVLRDEFGEMLRAALGG